MKDPEDYSPESGRRADPQRIIDHIHRHEARRGYQSVSKEEKAYQWNKPEHRSYTQYGFDGDVDADEPILPGFGPGGVGGNARDDCGDPHPHVCSSCGHYVPFGRTCSMSVCQRCGVAWARDAAITNAAKLVRIRKEKNWHTPDDELQKFHHQIISPPLHWWAVLTRSGMTLREAYDVTQDVVKYILDEMRGQGLIVRHSFRGTRGEDGLVPDPGDDDMGEWRERLNSGRDWYGDVRDELAWMPHWHCIVVSDFLRGDGFTDRIEEATGWIIHRIADENNVSIKNDGKMAKAVTYALSHADIDVVDDGNNNSARSWVGSFEGDIIKSSGRFTAQGHDLAWADAKVREHAVEVLGLKSGTTDCGADLPAVDDPNELARRILNEMYPDKDTSRVNRDHVLQHVAEGNIHVEVSTTSGGGGTVTVRDAFGTPVGPDGWGQAGNLPTPSSTTVDHDEIPTPIVDDGDQDDDHDGHDHDHGDDDGRCDGKLIPLEEARRRGFIDDPEWRRKAAHADEARAADREWSEDLDPWRTSSPGNAIGA